MSTEKEKTAKQEAKKASEKKEDKTDSTSNHIKPAEISQKKEETSKKTFDWESAEGQEVLRGQRKAKQQEETEESESKQEPSPREISLEETVAEERIQQRE